MWECFSCYKEILSFASALSYHSIDGVTEWYLVVIETSSIDMANTNL
jgi:hypothetical protein